MSPNISTWCCAWTIVWSWGPWWLWERVPTQETGRFVRPVSWPPSLCDDPRLFQERRVAPSAASFVCELVSQQPLRLHRKHGARNVLGGRLPKSGIGERFVRPSSVLALYQPHDLLATHEMQQLQDRRPVGHRFTGGRCRGSSH